MLPQVHLRSPEPFVARRKAPECSAQSLEPESCLPEKVQRVPRPEYPTGNLQRNEAGWNQKDEACSGLRNPKSARWRPPRLHIGKVERIQLRPQDVAFRLQRCNCHFLLGPRASVLDHKLQRESRVFRSLIETRREIIQ